MDFAKRAHDNNYKIDPIIRSLLDTDFYKLLMLQFIWKYYRNTEVCFKLINRSKDVRLSEIISEDELRAQLDYARTLRFKNNELIWLAGNKFYGERDIFEPAFIEWLRDFKLPNYTLSKTKDGQYELEFKGYWTDVTLWEIIGIVIPNTLRNRCGLSKMNKSELDIFYALGKARSWEKVKTLRGLEGLNLTDFSTRRRHDYLWQKWNVELFGSMLGTNFSGTSNALIAMELGLEAKGTNAHELPMVLAAIAFEMYAMFPKKERTAAILDSQYEVLYKWEQLYGGSLRVFLPDTFGTTQFLEHAPEWVAKNWVGMRPDSKDNFAAIEEAIKWWQFYGIDPKTRIIIPCNGLDTEDIVAIHNTFYGMIGLGYGWGTFFGNDFRDCHPRGLKDLDPISLVCKVDSVLVNGKWIPAIKLSDNYKKATGDKSTVVKYHETFGTAGMENIPVIV